MYRGGRCGCRSPQEVLEPASNHPDTLSAFAGRYWGLRGCDSRWQCRTRHSYLLKSSSVRSALFSRIRWPNCRAAYHHQWAQARLGKRRRGCRMFGELNWLLGDHPARLLCHSRHSIYLDAQSKVLQRAQVNQGYACELGGDCESALEVWAYVISRPEPTKQRVAGPVRMRLDGAGPDCWARLSQRRSNLSERLNLPTAVMDQHTFVETDGSSEIEGRHDCFLDHTRA